MAEEIFVVEVNGRDEGNGGNDDIGGVETPAQADFEDGEVDASARESLEGHGGEAFEISRVSAEFSGGEELLDEMVNAGEDFGEDIIGDFIAGEEISDDVFAEIFTRIHHLIEELLATGKLRAHPTYFECLTAMAFEAFARARVDFAVFEVGLGGRLDSTNVIIPAVTLITPIDFDHENFLGHSIREIAGEKAGILKPGVPVVVSPERTEARELILRRAAELGCPVVETETAFRVEHQSSEDGCERALVTEFASFRQFGVAPRLAGRFQLQNALTAAAAARVLAAHGFRIPDEAVSEGIAAAEWSGRLEKVHSQPDVYLDGAHNPAAARELAAFWSQNFADRKIRLVYGALREKAVDEIAGLLFPRAAEVVFTEPRTTRAISAAQLAEITAHHARSEEHTSELQSLAYLVCRLLLEKK